MGFSNLVACEEYYFIDSFVSLFETDRKMRLANVMYPDCYYTAPKADLSCSLSVV